MKNLINYGGPSEEIRFYQAYSEKDEIKILDKILIAVNSNENLIKTLAQFKISEVRIYLYTVHSGQYAYHLIEKVQNYKLGF